MIDFDKLMCFEASGASVGIGVNKQNPNALYLPKGYKVDDNITAEQKKQYFFDLYRLFKAYARKNKLDEKTDLKDKNQGGTFSKKDGYTIKVKEESGEDILLYTKVNFLDTILDAFDPYAIQNIANRKLYSDDFQFEAALNHLDDAVFLPNHSFMVDEALVTRHQVSVDPSELAQLFCFIYIDVKDQLGELESVEAYHKTLAEQFQDKHLFPNASLFAVECFEQTKALVKQRLETIHQHNPLKDDEYWKLYQAVYDFLYGDPIKIDNEQTYWGIKEFWPIWEDLCLEEVSNSELKDNVWMADTERDDLFGDTQELYKYGANPEKSCKIFYKEDIANYPFKLNFAGNSKVIRPDLIFTRTPSTKYILNDYRMNSRYTSSYTSSYTYWIMENTARNSIVDKELTAFFNIEFKEEYSGTYHTFGMGDESRKKRNNFLNLLNGENYIIIDFKYMSSLPANNSSDSIKQMLYMNCLNKFSVSEFWLPDSEGNSIPSQFADFEDNTRQNIKLRKINIHNLVKSYIGAKS